MSPTTVSIINLVAASSVLAASLLNLRAARRVHALAASGMLTEARVRELMRAEVAIGVAAGAGDTDRLLLKLRFLRHELDSGALASKDPHTRLVQLANSAMDQANAVRGVMTDFATQRGSRPR